ncbi:MAG: RDD family protein [Thermoanaerobaculia bacterium]
MPQRRFDPQSLAITPALAGSILPSPLRRALAFAIDAALLLLPTIAAAALFSGLALHASDPAGYRALRTALFAYPDEPTARHALLRDLAPALARIDAAGLPSSVKADIEAGELDRAADRLAEMNLQIALDLGENEAKPLTEGTVRLEVERLIPAFMRAAALFFVPAIYFGFAISRWGATIGKRLLGLRVVRLDGERLSFFASVERFGAYFGILGTLGLGLLDLWKDPNRRLGHDRAVDTVVVRRFAVRAP